ncbi:MAG TPA: LTA synthase family protein [Bacillales bacterium]|nr:LTA synthase family protein [Bacillales bacterium]
MIFFRGRSTWIFYLTAVILFWLKSYAVLQFYTDLKTTGLLQQIILWINPIASSILVLSLSFFFGKKLRGSTVLIVDFLATMLLYADILYYRFYIDFITLPVITQLPNVGGLSQSTVALASPYDVFLFVDLLALFVWWRKDEWRPTPVTKKQRGLTVTVAVLFLLANVALVKAENPNLFKAFYNREAIAKAFGIMNYHLYDLVSQLKPVAALALASDNDLEEIQRYVAEHEISPNPVLFGKYKNQNVILISLESTQTFVIHRKVNGQEVTPFLNDLIDESYYFDHFYHQTEQGKTSDAEFLIDNSLYPLPSGSVFVRYPDHEYEALPEILDRRGYQSVVFHGNDRTFWNRDDMYDSLGYDRFYSARDYRMTEENTINYGLKDIPFFEQSMKYVKQLEPPFYAKFITLSNHFPFLIDPEDELIDPPNSDYEIVNRYFMTVRYEDEALKRFFQELKASGLYDSSIIVLYGDHYGISEAYEEGLEQVLGEQLSPVERIRLQRVPLIIHVPGQTEGKTIHTVGGEIDIRPTLLHLLGIDTSKFIHFGHDLFSPEKEDFVVFRDGSFVTDAYVYTGNECYRKSDGALMAKSMCRPWFDRRSAELENSDQVIYQNLLQFKEK